MSEKKRPRRYEVHIRADGPQSLRVREYRSWSAAMAAGWRAAKSEPHAAVNVYEFEQNPWGGLFLHCRAKLGCDSLTPARIRAMTDEKLSEAEGTLLSRLVYAGRLLLRGEEAVLARQLRHKFGGAASVYGMTDHHVVATITPAGRAALSKATERDHG